VVSIANPARHWQGEPAFVDNRVSAPSPSTWTTDWRFRFYRRVICGLGRKAHQSRLESLLHALSILCGQTIFGAKGSMSPICGLFRRSQAFHPGYESLTQFSRRIGFQFLP
jgi:hypothetical protein